MKLAGSVRKQVVVAVAIASLGIALLTGCTSGTAKPAVLTTKAAAAYYLATTCKRDAAADLFTGAVSIAAQGSAETGPDLDNLKSAALGYEQASRVAAASLDHPKAAWPASVRKSVLVMRDQYLSQLPSLKAMAAAAQMSDAADAFSNLPKTTKAVVATKLIRSKLGLPVSTASNSCPPPPAISAAPATGILIAGTGYTFHAPAGWTVPKSAPQADAYVIAAKPDEKGYYDSINVLISDSNTDTLDEQEQNGAEYLGQVERATAIQIRPRVEISGVEGVHVSSLLSRGGITRRNELYDVTRGGSDYIITFDFNEAESQAAREAFADSVLASWTWT